jgi:hypothetical protein
VTTGFAGNENPDFTSPAREATIQKVMAALRANNIDARVVDTREDARRLVLEPDPAPSNHGVKPINSGC